MYVKSNICYPMYCVLECHSKPINVPTDTNICLYKHQLVINLLITLHSFLTWCNKACNLNGNCNGNQLKSIHHYEPWFLMVHLWSQWQVINLGGYLEVIVSGSVRLFSFDCLYRCEILQGPGPWWLRLFSEEGPLLRLVSEDDPLLGLVSEDPLPPVYITLISWLYITIH